MPGNLSVHGNQQTMSSGGQGHNFIPAGSQQTSMGTGFGRNFDHVEECPPEFMRAVSTVIPSTKKHLKNCGLPIACVINPLSSENNVDEVYFYLALILVSAYH